jgi:hypothetical protein
VASSGSWRDAARLSFSWERCNSRGAACSAIRGVRGRSYRTTTADLGKRVRVRVRASNKAGQAVSLSQPMPLIEMVSMREDPSLLASSQPGDRRSWIGLVAAALATLTLVVAGAVILRHAGKRRV